jgi:hypothetical protein
MGEQGLSWAERDCHLRMIAAGRTVSHQVTDYKTVCVPRMVCRQVPVEVCVKVPVMVYCPPVVLPSAQSVLASSQSVPLTTVPPCDPCDSNYPILGRKHRLFH